MAYLSQPLHVFRLSEGLPSKQRAREESFNAQASRLHDWAGNWSVPPSARNGFCPLQQRQHGFQELLSGDMDSEIRAK